MNALPHTQQKSGSGDGRPTRGPTTITHSPTVLVVEDHSALNRILGIRLQTHGFDVRSAFDGVEALTIAYAQTPDIVLLDMGLPRMSGMEVLQDLASTPETRDIPVIVVTGDSRMTDRELRGRGNVAGVLHKPVSAVDVVAAVQTELGNRLDPDEEP